MLDKLLDIQENYIYGQDEYCMQDLEYPEVYAKFSIALYEKWEQTQEEKYKNKAYVYLDRMCELKVEDQKGVHWGLPFDWGNTKKEDGFLITTCFCIQSLNIWKDKRWNSIIEKAITWCFKLIVQEENSSMVEIYYSPKLKENIFNASAIACGTFLEWEALSKEKQDIVYRILEGIIYNQKKKGYWNYSLRKTDVDLLHQCYTVEGLIRSYPYVYETKLKRKLELSIKKGIEFIIERQWKYVDKSERYLFSFGDQEKINEIMKHSILKIMREIGVGKKHFQPTRCWSYAAFLRVIFYYQMYFKMDCRKEISSCIKKIKEDLFQETYVKYSKCESKNYARHQAHMVEALAYVNK